MTTIYINTTALFIYWDYFGFSLHVLCRYIAGLRSSTSQQRAALFFDLFVSLYATLSRGNWEDASVGLRESGKGTENTFMLESRPILVLYHHPFGPFLACRSNSGYTFIFSPLPHLLSLILTLILLSLKPHKARRRKNWQGPGPGWIGRLDGLGGFVFLCAYSISLYTIRSDRNLEMLGKENGKLASQCGAFSTRNNRNCLGRNTFRAAAQAALLYVSKL